LLGDPTGTGKGGKSIWGKPFPDEYHETLKHEGEGMFIGVSIIFAIN
jgi:hypothetical protein